MKSKVKVSVIALLSVMILAAIACASAQAPAAQPSLPQENQTPTPTTEPSEREMVEAMAPIDGVQINIAESFPPQYFVQVQSGIPNGCTSFDRYEVERDDKTINISVYNMEPAPGQDIACTLIYGFKENNIALGADFEPGVEYTLNINDVTETFVAQGESEPAPEVAHVPAPIDGVQIELNEDGSEAELLVSSGLPNSCHEFQSIDVNEDGQSITVEVINSRLDGNVACAEIYQTVQNRVTLERELEACEMVAVVVNGDTYDVRAIAPNVRCSNMVSVPAPIESVEVNKDSSGYSLLIVSRLPKGSSCSQHEGFDVERDGNTINVTVTNLEVVNPEVCTADLPIVETIVPLGKDFKAGETYTVNVNDEVTETFVADEDEPFVEMISVPAPIESVEIIVDGANPTQYSLRVISRQSRGSSCTDFEGFEVERDGNTIHVTVTNLEVAEANVPCTRDLPVDETIISLGSNFEADVEYTVIVNGEVTETFVAEDRELDMGMLLEEVPAPIESVKVVASGTSRVDYALVVTSALPNGCTEFGSYDVTRDGNTINVEVKNLVPTDANIACILIFRLHESRIPLGSDFVDGETYTVEVNDVTETFVAGEVSVEQSQATLNREFRVGLGEIASIESEGLEIRFVEVLEDSRCAADVVCVWEGQARIMIDVASSEMGLGQHELFLESVREDRSTIQAGDYLVQIRALDPNPSEVGQIDTNSANYVATLVVFENVEDYGY